MAKNRSYRLLCPIARGLDRLGDRWTLLILRDLHAGPARYNELQHGLNGLASNLLSSRLEKMQSDELIERVTEDGVTVYQLTDLGRRSAGVLFELAMFGSAFPPPEEIRKPGNLRTMVVTLSEALRRVPTPNLSAELVVDGEEFAIELQPESVEVRYAAFPEAPLRVESDYEPMMAMTDGELDPVTFVENHWRVVRGSKRDGAKLLQLIGSAFVPD